MNFKVLPKLYHEKTLLLMVKSFLQNTHKYYSELALLSVLHSSQHTKHHKLQ